MALPASDPPPPAAAATDRLIGDAYAVDTSRPLPGAGGGLAAFAASDRRSGRGDLMAVQVRANLPPRAQALNVLSMGLGDGVLTPLAHGPVALPGSGAGGGAGRAWFVICQAPPGPALWPPSAGHRPWAEAELLERLVRPAAQALEWLQSRHVTHRAIRPDNLFRAGPGDPVTLGCAWAAPPALLQPAVFEPPYSAMCLPAGRGPGTIADDVYALGVVLLTLALGRVPLAGMDDLAVVRRKLEVGSYAALAGEERLPSAIADLVRGMLAEDPEHRPPPALLADPAAARSRRVAARPPRRAQQPLAMPVGPVWNARTLAHAIATDPEQGVRLLRNGEVDRWLRRNVGDPTLAVRLDDAVRQRGIDADAEDGQADALLALRSVALLDPLAPVTWRGLAVWPDGLGPALAAALPAGQPGGGRDAAARDGALAEMLAAEAIGAWAAARPERGDPTMLTADAHQLRATVRLRGWGGGTARLRYTLNPLLPCASPGLAGRMVVRLGDLLPALEAAAARPDAHRVLPIDAEIGAFLAARHETRVETELARLLEPRSTEHAALVQLRLLAWLQQRQRIAELPNLAAWLGEHTRAALSVWRQRQRRAQLGEALGEFIRAGQLPAMLAVLEDPALLAADARGAREATLAVQTIDRELAAIATGGPARAESARRLGQDVVLGVGLSAMAVAAIAAILA